MYGHRRVAIAGGGAAAKALVKVLPAEIVDEEAVGPVCAVADAGNTSMTWSWGDRSVK